MKDFLYNTGRLVTRYVRQLLPGKEFNSFSLHTGKERRSGVKLQVGMSMLVAAILFCSINAGELYAQNLINTGQINNSGTLRVKYQATGLPPVVDGTVEYFGANQTVTPVQYRILRLSGSGTKTSSPGNFTVTDSVILASGILFRVDSNSTLVLDGTLDENGYLLGKIQKTVNLSGGTTTSMFGNIGSTITWSGTEPGATTVLRATGIVSTGNGNQSIARYYDIAPTTNTGLNAELTLSYANGELNGHDSSYLQLWKSEDGGATWQYAMSVANPGARTVMGSGISSFSRWTLADTSNYPLGTVVTQARIIVKHYIETDGNISTSADRIVKPWAMAIYQDSVNGLLIGSVTSDTVLDVMTTTGGTFYIVESDSAGWTRLGYQTGVASPVASPSNTVSVSVSLGQTSLTRFYTFKNGLLAGTKFNDLNTNGIREVGENGIAGWKIRLSKNGSPYDSTVTLGDGSYSFSNLANGTYEISEEQQAEWLQTLPVSGGTYTIALQSGQALTGNDFGNYRYGSIAGSVFEDVNGDSIMNGGEIGLAGWRVRLINSGLQVDSTLTAVDGSYAFNQLLPGTYTVRIEVQSGWLQSLPAACEYAGIVIGDNVHITGKDFGNYRGGVISGMLFYDRNGNNLKDVGETGLSGWTINADASNPSYNRTVLSQIGGIYSITALRPDNYTLSLTVKPNWTQSYPTPATYNLNISSGSNVSDYDFGVVAPLDSFMFRSFSVESLIVQKSVSKRKCTGFRFAFNFVNKTDRAANGIYIEFNNIVTEFTEYAPFAEVQDLGQNAQDYKFLDGVIESGDTAHIEGFSVITPCQIRISKWHWLWNDTNISKRKTEGALKTSSFTKDIAMPNAANVRDETFRRGFQLGGGMKIGVMKTDDARRYGWVRILKSADLYRSLYDRKTMQTGTPRGFNLFSNNGRFVGEQKVLVPSKYNNRLFAELAALKFNIEASNRGITPAGLGEIVYDEGLNPLSGMAIKDIAKRADTLMTYWYDRSPDEYMNLDTTVRKINHAFSGSIDTASYFSLLALKGVRTVSEISFLRLPADITPIIEQKKHVLEQNGEMPGSYVLYQNYPNPFNPVTTIEFALPHQSEVTLTLFDVLGREVATLVDKEILEEGIQYVDFYADGLPSGVYFYKIVAKQVSEEGETGELFIDTKKMMYVR